MVMESTDNGIQSHWDATTNWIVIGGSLANSVAVESFDTPTDLQNNIVSRKSPLILNPPSSDSVPCEITINFTKRHEVRQVYVRSTARVYEIYITPKVQGDNEYLCTVRCGIAAKEDEIPDVALSNEDGSPCLGESKHSNDEEWVEVKVPNASAARNGVSTVAVNPCMDMDLYEATAEISDADPCISLTLRLVSIQSRGCVYVEEVYVFVDPIDIDSDTQEDKAGHIAGSSALAMIIPSILQISRAKGGNVEQDKHKFGLRDNRPPPSEAGNVECERLPEEVNETPTTAKKVEEEMKHHVTNDKQTVSSTVVVQPCPKSQQPDNGRSNLDAPSGRVETLLEQLVSRVCRMEDLYLRFEESMLRPINNIEARLQQVELKIESLFERQLNHEERHCKRFSALEYSLSESNVNSMYSNETENYKCGEPDQHLHKTDCSDKSSDLHDGVDDLLENTPHFIPCLTITAPEFSQCDEDDNYCLEASLSSVSDLAKEKPRHVSIDDALATALAGFMSSVPVRHTQSLVVKAPDFSNEEDENIEVAASPETRLNVSASSSSLCTGEVMFAKDSLITSLGNKVHPAHVNDGISITVEKSNKDHHNEREILQETKGLGKAAAGEAVIECSKCPLIIVQSTEHGEMISSLALGDTEEGSNELLEIHAPSPVIAKEDSQENIIQDLLLAYSVGSASIVDYKSPILDVTFLPQVNGSLSIATLEGLSCDESETSFRPPTERISETCSVVEQHHFIVLDDESEPLDQISNSGFSLDIGYCDLPDMAVKQVDEKPDEEQLSSGSLI